MTTYLKVRWKHSYTDEPVLLFSELDDNRNEVRKIEIFPNGTLGYADVEASAHGTELGEGPLPSDEEIETDPQFSIEEVTGPEFECLWAVARGTAQP